MQTPAAPAAFNLNVDLDKIRERVYSEAPVITTDKAGIRFYVNTVAPFPKFKEIVGSFDLFKGPTPYASMSHQEMVAMTRPKDMYSSAGITAGDFLRFAALSYVEGKAFELLRKAAVWMREAKTDAERKEIQARIERELAALKGETIVK